MEGAVKIENLQDIKQTVIVNATIQKVWDTVSTSEGIASWFMPNDFEPIVGQEFHLQSPFGPSPCKVLEIDEPNKIIFSWDTEGWIISFLLKDLGKKRNLRLYIVAGKQRIPLFKKQTRKALSFMKG